MINPTIRANAIALILMGLAPLSSAQSDSADSNSAGRQLMQQGSYLLREAEDLNQAAQQQLQASNKLRQQLLQARREQSDNANVMARSLAQQINTLQQQGTVLRSQSNTRLNEAKQHFARGMQALWPAWIKTADYFSGAPLVDDSQQLSVQAHNTLERSVHPGLEATGPRATVNQATDMSLAVNNSGVQNQAADVDRSTFQLSRNQYFVGHIEAENFSAQTGHQVPINKIHAWRLVLSDPRGNPIESAEIQFLGHMPGHVHGLPTQPQIGRELSPGVYEVLGVKFQMRGWWVIDFAITSGDVEDIVRFNLVL